MTHLIYFESYVTVTGQTRHETCGSICRALFRDVVTKQARFMQWQTGTGAFKLECHEKVIFSCNLFQKVKLSYILDS